MPPKQNFLEKLASIKKVFDTSKILELDTSPEQIAKYYNLNRLAYWLFVSREGFVHMGLSKNDILQPGDFSQPAKEIAEYIKIVYAKEVLELGAGKGGNLQYLARTSPDINFYGMDLKGGQTKKKRLNKLPNVNFSYGDYHDLQRYDSDSKDIIFIVEALCHAQPKEKVIQEVYRILKPGGSFIVYDGYNIKRYSEMNKNEELVVRLGWKGMLVNPDDMHIDDFRKYLRNTGYKIIKDEDLGKAVLPSLRSLERPAIRFFKHPMLAKMINKLLPTHFTANTISGYVMPHVVESNLCTYNLTLAKK